MRELATAHGAVLIFDEVVTGFRLGLGGAQEQFGVLPDMATYAKAISNGYAMGAVVGRRAMMEMVGDMIVSSTYWSDAVGLAANYLYRDLVTPLGRSADLCRAGLPAPRQGTRCCFQTAGLYRLSWPRPLLLHRIGRQLCQIRIVWPGFQKQHRTGMILGQACGQHVPG